MLTIPRTDVGMGDDNTWWGRGRVIVVPRPASAPPRSPSEAISGHKTTLDLLLAAHPSANLGCELQSEERSAAGPAVAGTGSKRRRGWRPEVLSPLVAAKIAQAKADLDAAVNAPLPCGRDPTAWLPEELLITVLLCVPFEALWHGWCSLVCRRWHTVIRNSRVLQRRLREGRWHAYEQSQISGRVVTNLHHYSITALASGLDGNVYSASLDRTVRVWSARRGKLLQTLEGHTGGVRALVLTVDTIYSGSQDHTVRVWRVKDGAHIRTLTGHTAGVRALAMAPSGNLYSGSMDQSIRVWSDVDGSHIRTLRGHSNAVLAVAVGHHGEVYSGSWDCTIRVWSDKTGVCLRTLEGHTDAVRALCVGPTGDLYSASEDCTIQAWSGFDGARLRTLNGHTADIFALVISASGELYSASNDSKILVWPKDKSTPLSITTGRGGGVFALTLGTNGKLYAGLGDRSFTVW